MANAIQKQIGHIVGPHAGDDCMPWDASHVPLFRDQNQIPEELRPVATELVDRHQWVSRGCLSLMFPDRIRGEELGQDVWVSLFEALVTPGREVQSLHAFIGGVMANQLTRKLNRRARDRQMEPLEIMTPKGPMERPGLVDPQPDVDEQAWRTMAMDTVLSNLDLFDRILVIGFADRTSLKDLRKALLEAGDLRVTAATPDNNIKTFQNTALRRARRLLDGEHSRTSRREKE